MSWEGVAAGVDEKGALLLDTDKGQKSFHGGKSRCGGRCDSRAGCRQYTG
ncbi:hypothetical protein P0078_11110 [Microbulbifer sp. VAAF005]|nr:hypothetical protein [Microbulbifer sp. VAAF005]WHI48876.1 hypothetical protein P0078_11110 [Microbulbifer sp. VAAF005]